MSLAFLFGGESADTAPSTQAEPPKPTPKKRKREEEDPESKGSRSENYKIKRDDSGNWVRKGGSRGRGVKRRRYYTERERDQYAHQQQEQQEKQERLDKLKPQTIWVGNLHIETTQEELHELFGHAGKILRIQLVYHNMKKKREEAQDEPVNPIERKKTEQAELYRKRMLKRKLAAALKASKEEQDPRIRTFTAFIIFNEEAAVEKALKYHATILNGHHLRVDGVGRMRSNPGFYGEHPAVFLANVVWEGCEEDVWTWFKQHGITDVEDVHLLRSKETGLCTGAGFARFSTKKSVQEALKLDQEKMKGRPIGVYPFANMKEHKKKEHRQFMGDGENWWQGKHYDMGSYTLKNKLRIKKTGGAVTQSKAKLKATLSGKGRGGMMFRGRGGARRERGRGRGRGGGRGAS